MFRLTKYLLIICTIGLGINLYINYINLDKADQGWIDENGNKFVASNYVLTSYVVSEKERSYFHSTVKKNVVNMYMPNGMKSKSMSHFELSEYVNYFADKDTYYPAQFFEGFKKMVMELNAETGFNPGEPLVAKNNSSTCFKDEDNNSVEPGIIMNVLYLGCFECARYLIDEWNADVNMHFCSGMSLADVVIRWHHGSYPEFVKLGFDINQVPKEYVANIDGARNILDTIINGDWPSSVSKNSGWTYEDGFVGALECETSFNGKPWNRCNPGLEQIANYFRSIGYIDRETNEAISLCGSSIDNEMRDNFRRTIENKANYVIGGRASDPFIDGKSYIVDATNKEWYISRLMGFDLNSSNRFCGRAYYVLKRYCDKYNLYCDKYKKYKNLAFRDKISEAEFNFVAKQVFVFNFNCGKSCGRDMNLRRNKDLAILGSTLRNQDSDWFWIDYAGSDFEHNEDPHGYIRWKFKEADRIFGTKKYILGNK